MRLQELRPRGERTTQHAVACSHQLNISIACSALSPHTSGSAMNREHTAERSGLPNRAQRLSAVRWIQATPAGLRSEERRVGKECRGRWAAEQYKKKQCKDDSCEDQAEDDRR